jgi:hypothetical protein
MWFIKSKFVGDQDTYTEELENVIIKYVDIDIHFIEFKYNRRVSKWYDIVMENCFQNDAELKLRIIETILKYKNEQDGKNRSFVIEKYEA